VLARTIHIQDSESGLTWLEVVGPTLSQSEGANETDSSHLYEYGWTLGFRISPVTSERTGSHGYVRKLRDRDVPPGQATVVHVRLLFPVWPDRFVSAHAATVKHLSPVEKEEQWRQRLATDWNTVAPVVQAAGTVATDVTGLAPIGSVAKAVASLRATSVPQTPDTLWFVRAVDDIDDQGHLHHGVEWEIPRSLLVEVGTQISGSLLVSTTAAATAFSPAATWQAPNAPVLASATLMAGETELDRLPTDDPFVELDVFARDSGSGQ
jgi:hypothetical protein